MNKAKQDAQHDKPHGRHKLIIGALVAVSALVAHGVYSRIDAKREMTTWTDAESVPIVSVIHPTYSTTGVDLTLPGRLAAYYDAPIFARVSGYLRKWNVDIGSHVVKGQVLAEIETPDLDAQYSQAKAKLDDAVASENLSRVTAKRWQDMMSSDSVSQQAVDEKTSDLQVKQAESEAARADVARLRALESYKNIVAPFDGIVTVRNTDIGQLINAGSDKGDALFRVAAEKQLRVYVDVPQNYAADISSALQASLTVPELPGQIFSARYISTASAINISTGAVTVELLVDNAAGKLIPGAYTQVKLTLGKAAHVLRLPSASLILGRDGEEVATVGRDNRIVMKRVTIAQDLGDYVEIGSGIDVGDSVVANPSDSIRSGDVVKIASVSATTEHGGGTTKEVGYA